MKSDKALWGSISILVGTVIAILALIRGAWRTWLLIGVFSLWGLWVIAVLLRPCMQQAKRRRMREQLAKKRLTEGISPSQPAVFPAMDHRHTAAGGLYRRPWEGKDKDLKGLPVKLWISSRPLSKGKPCRFSR